MSLRRLQFVVAVALVLVTVPAVAQTVTGTMRGTVTDKSGGVLPGVTVTVRNIETGLERNVVTGRDGTYNAPFLPIGRYNVQAELSGFGAMRHNNVPVDLNQTVVQDFVLDPAVTETVTVNANAPRIDVTDGEIKQTLRSEEIMNIPSAGQTNFLRLATLFTGFQENPTSGQDNPTLSSGSSVAFNGAGTRGTTFQINGVNNDDSSENQHRQGVALATIQSFQVLTNNYSSEFGRGYGAVVLVQTKSGTNDVAGEVYGYGQDNKYQSRSVTQVSLNHGTGYRRQYGATAGFPILRDRLFAFVNVDNVGLKSQVTPTRGMFTAEDLALPRLTKGNDTPANRAWQDKIMSYWPKGTTPNAPNFGPRAFQALVDTSFPDREASGRLDWNATSANTLTARYQRDHQIRTPGELIIGENAVQNNREGTFGASWTGVLSSTTVQEARVGIGIRSTNVNISAGNDTPIVRFNNTGITATFTILGNAGAYPIIRNQRDTQLVYNISSAQWTKHTLKLGTDLRKGHLNDVSDNYSRGFWTFNELCNNEHYGTGIAAFMAGCVGSYWKGYGPFNLKNDFWEANVYGQDDWRPFDNLTLNLGLRYERVGAPKEKDNKIDYVYKTSDYVDPRLGFAYTPDWDRNRVLRALTGGSGKFSIRGGYGTFHGRVFQSIFSQGGANVRFNPPTAAFYQLSGDFSTQMPGASPYNIADPTNGFVFVPGPQAGRTPSLTLISPNLKMPETHQFNLTFERQIFWQSRLRLSYIGLRGVNLLQYTFDNLPISPVYDPTSPYKVAADWLCAGTGQTVSGVKLNPTATCPNVVPLADNEISIRAPRNNERRPNPNGSANLVVSNGSKSWYNAAQIEWETGTHHGFQGKTTYTFSKNIDEGSEATFVGTGDINIFPPNERFKRGLSRLDTRHRFTLLGIYALPWLQNRRDLVGSLFGGWQVSAVAKLASGNPFTIVDSGALDVDFDGVGNARPVVVDPNFSGGWHINYPGNAQAKVPKSAFRHPTYGDTLDNLIGRNTYYTDGVKNVDLGLYKTFQLAKGYALMFRVDAFDVFNQVTWWYPDNNFNNSTFMKLTSTNYSPRLLQAGFRFIY